MSAAVIISAINALTLSPALCGLLLRPGGRQGLMAQVLGVIDRVQSGYASIVRRTVGFAALSLLAVAIAAAGAFFLFRLIPTGFLPEEDQGFFFAEVDLPPGASVNRTDALTSEVEKIVRAEKDVAALTSIIGFSQLNSVALSNAAFLVVRLAPFEERTDPSLSLGALIARIKAENGRHSGSEHSPLQRPAHHRARLDRGLPVRARIGRRRRESRRSRSDHAGARLRGPAHADTKFYRQFLSANHNSSYDSFRIAECTGDGDG